MNVSVIINSHEIREYIAEGGLSIGTENRIERSVVTMDGTKYKLTVPKRKIDVTIIDNLLASNLTTLKGYLATNPAIVSYSNYETGATGSGTFYVNDFKYNIKKGYGSDALITGASFSLEEQ